MAISIQQVKALREETGVSVVQCKKALEESDGDAEKAKVLLRKKGTAFAAKKSNRELGAGVVSAYTHTTGDVASLVALSCETDFVAKNRDFSALAYDMAMHVTAANPECLSRDRVDEDDLRRAREVFGKEAADKPSGVRDKIVAGKLDTYLKEKVLLEQDFIKDSSRTIKDLLDEATQKFGERIEITDFSRLSVR